MIELRSDTFTLPTPEMIAAMGAAELGDDGYREDPTVRRLEEFAADLLGKAAACLFPSGTMANLAAILTYAPRGSRVLVGDRSDIYLDEADGAAVLGGLAYAPVPTTATGELLLSAVEEALDPLQLRPLARPALLCLENTHNRCGGTVLSPSYLTRLRRLTRPAGLPIHLDGARLFHASVALDLPVTQLAAVADSVQICLSKGLSAPVGAILCGTAEFIAQARQLRRMLGGTMRQAGVIAAAGIIGLRDMPARLAEDHHHAARLAAGLRSLPGVIVDTDPVSTNIVMFRLAPGQQDGRGFLSATRRRGLALTGFGRDRFRAVTHRGVAPCDIDRAVAIIAESLVTRPGPVAVPASLATAGG